MRSIAIIIFILSIGSICFGALSKTSPTSTTTKNRIDAYNDAMKTIYLSTQTQDSVVLINEIVDKDVEQYMVYPSSYVPKDSKPWLGYCWDSINKKSVKCP